MRAVGTPKNASQLSLATDCFDLKYVLTSKSSHRI